MFCFNKALQTHITASTTHDTATGSTQAEGSSHPNTVTHASKKRPLSFEQPSASFKKYKHSEGEVITMNTSMTDSPTPQADVMIGSSLQMSLSAAAPPTINNPLLIDTKFLDVKNELEHILQDCDTTAILNQCTHLMASSVNGITLFSSEYMQTLRECKHFPSFIQTLMPYYNWTDHSVLATVVDACNNSAASNLLQQFESHIDVSLPITDYPIPQPCPNMMPYDTSTHTVVAVRMNARQRIVSLQQMFDMQCLLQEKFQLTPHTLLLLAANNMNIIIYWSIPKCVVSVIATNITQISSDLHNSGIMELSIYPGFMFLTSSALRVGSLSYLNRLNCMVIP